jgi:hypothetical protein
MAVGRARFLEMAVDMTLSLREHTSLPVALAADDPLAADARARFPDVFDDVRVVPERFLDGRARKFGVAEASPWEETMFVDADCIVLDSLEHLWGALEYSELAMVGAQLSRVYDENHHGFSTLWLMERFDLERYMKTNSGIFCYRRSAALQIMEECLECFLEEARPRLRRHLLLGRWLGDEIVFGIVGGRRRLRTFPAPSAMYWPQDFHTIDLAAPTKPLLHLIWPPSKSLVDALMADIAERRGRAGLPLTSEEHWRDEIRSLERMVRRRRLLELVGLY